MMTRHDVKKICLYITYTSSSITTTQMKTFIIFYFLNKMMKQHKFLKRSRTATVLKNISLPFCKRFIKMITKNLIFVHLKIQSIYFTDLMILLKHTLMMIAGQTPLAAPHNAQNYLIKSSISHIRAYTPS